MHWESALKEIEKNPDPEALKPIIQLLHQEINQGKIAQPLFLSGLEDLYKRLSHPGLLGEIKRMQNRYKIRTMLGCDLLRLTSPPLGDKEKKKMWEDVHALQSAYNENKSRGGHDFKSAYKVLNKIGDGGMSVVFKAIRLNDNKEVAIKFLDKAYFSCPAIVERFDRECTMSIEFSHPNIIDVYDIGLGGMSGYMVMELLDSGGVDEILKNDCLDIEVALDIILQACDAVSYIHKKNIVHRDVKLSNLLIKSWNKKETIHIKLCDFGISKDFSQNALTSVGTKMGTEFYAAPEQREAFEKANFRSDIYSLGVCLYRLITKKWFPEGNFPAVNEINPLAPEALNKTILKCLNHNPDGRFHSVEALKEQLTLMKAEIIQSQFIS